MHADVAAATAKATRKQAVHDAINDLWEMRRRAVEAGRERSRQIAKTTRITQAGELHYNPAGRLLRDWYLHVYMNTLRTSLGESAVVIDAQQVEDTAGLLRRIRNADGLAALQVVALMRDTAIDDATHATVDIIDHLSGVAAHRAILLAGDDRFDQDQLAIHVTRHWYQHCYLDQLDGATRTRHPLGEVTDGQEREVAKVLASGQARQLIGVDRVPLVTIHGTELSRQDRQLAAGLAGLVSPFTDTEHHTDTNEPLSGRVTLTWNDLNEAERRKWLRAADARHIPGDRNWTELPGDVQSKIIRLYLDTHRPDQGLPLSRLAWC